jgi:hypothetical protein
MTGVLEGGSRRSTLINRAAIFQTHRSHNSFFCSADSLGGGPGGLDIDQAPRPVRTAHVPRRDPRARAQARLGLTQSFVCKQLALFLLL